MSNYRTVGQVASLLGVSIRTLHYWEQRGLIGPADRSYADYRLYSDSDVERLQMIQLYKTTGLPLNAIAEIMSANSTKVAHLHRQRELLMQKQEELAQMVQAIDMILEDAMSENNLSVEDIAELLGAHKMPVYQQEAADNWGQTDDWAISQRTSANMDKQAWLRLKARTDNLEERLAAAMQQKTKPGSPEANALAEEHRALLSEFFPVTHSKHALIAHGYVADARFREYYDSRAAGLAEWLTQVIHCNASAQGVDLENLAWQ